MSNDDNDYNDYRIHNVCICADCSLLLLMMITIITYISIMEWVGSSNAIMWWDMPTSLLLFLIAFVYTGDIRLVLSICALHSMCDNRTYNILSVSLWLISKQFFVALTINLSNWIAYLSLSFVRSLGLSTWNCEMHRFRNSRRDCRWFWSYKS